MRVALMMLVLTAVLGSPAFAEPESHSSKTPPKGPPWVHDFAEARALALEKGKPIFVYSTKTY